MLRLGILSGISGTLFSISLYKDRNNRIYNSPENSLVKFMIVTTYTVSGYNFYKYFKKIR